MEVLLLLLVIVVLIVLISFKNSVDQKLDALNQEVKRLSSVHSELVVTEAPPIALKEEKQTIPTKEEIKPVEKMYWQSGFQLAEDENASSVMLIVN